MRHALHRCGAGADDGDALVLQLVQWRAKSIAAGVIIVPAAGVEAVTLEAVQPRNPRQLGHMQRPRPHADIIGGEAVTAIGGDDPDALALIPDHVGHPGVEQRLVIQAKGAADAL